MKLTRIIIALFFLTPLLAEAAKTQYLDLVDIKARPSATPIIHRYAVNLASSQKPLQNSEINSALNQVTDLVYINKVKVNNTVYFRLVAGNYATQKIATAKLRELKRFYPGAWINFRNRAEIGALSKRLRSKTATAPIVIPPKAKTQLPVPAPAPLAKPRVAPAPVKKQTTAKKPAVPLREPPKDFAERLMIKARKLFLDGKYARVLATTDKIAEVGNQQQREIALEMSGLVRERQNKLAQAAAIYTEFLKLYPDSEMVPKIEARLEGLRTMFNDPREQLARKPDAEKPASWNIYGSVSQFYRNDTLNIDGLGSNDVSDLLLTDVYLVARQRARHSSLELRYDGGLVSDLLESHNTGRTRQALVNYTDTRGEYQVIGGRQNRTARGVFSRFDGVVFNGSTQGPLGYSLYMGSPVHSSEDGINDEQSFIGGSLRWKYSDALGLDFYLLTQQIESLTDREAIGTEIQYKNDLGFFYGIVDYDNFYGELNNLTAVGNFRYNAQWTLNSTLSFLKSPQLSTYNAIQGQAVNDFSELQSIHGLTDQQIYDLARDRTSDATTLLVNAAYEMDPQRQLDFGVILSSIDASDASAATSTTPAIAATEATDSTHLSVDYSIKGYFLEKDHTTFGARLIDSTAARILSFSGRSRLQGLAKRLFYDPRVALDFRHNESSDIDQFVLRTSLRIDYRPSRKWNLKADLGIEYSDEDLPNNNTQTLYSLLFGYSYQF